jgi:hypothetical protein
MESAGLLESEWGGSKRLEKMSIRVKQHSGLKVSCDITMPVSRAQKIQLFLHSFQDDAGCGLDGLHEVAARLLI